ncbi:DUF4097 family beta strand repeat-containing protein [Oceanobacillus chungangensis]|uniref:DUF4097 domain-containing protein n=1 Tax=Oceanobacillus chungangensis TaxID=1229152 RepID=A0A3D8PHT0_9BACI|nr:DUF4097 family beta strand repeat-containing protein [Oceanobacillus chungangensis]RDW15630.1 hypothetical protein CWR45_17815 [Oceanobacillus chungangensis]
MKMKKNTIVVLIVAAVFIAAIMNFLPFGPNGKTEHEQTINEAFTKVDIETENVEIEILSSNSSAAEIELKGNKNNKYKLETKVEGDTLQIEVKDRLFRWFSFGFFNSSSVSLKVFLPERAYDTIEVVTDNGKIRANEMEADVINMEADNGKIIVDHIKSTSFNFEVDNGEVSLRDIEGEINGSSNNGRISLITESLDSPITLETDNGVIDIQTDEQPANATFDINVDNGKVTVFGESNYDTIIGNGDNLIKLTADNGKITIQ